MPEDDWQRSVLGDVGRMPGTPSTPPAHRVPVPAPQPAAARPQPQPRVAPLQPPAPVPTLAPDAAALATGKPQRGESLVRRTGRSLLRLVASSAASDVEQATRVARELQQPITTGRQIVVTSVRGGAGKTTVAALLGSAYAHYRSDAVLVIEANPTLGTLPARLGAPSLRWTIDDLARVLAPSMRFDQVVGYLVGLPEGGWLLPGSRGQIGAHVSWEAYQTVVVALRRYFGVTVADCESLPGELARSAMVGAQARVLVAPATVEGVVSTRTVLDWMATIPRPMLPSTVVALVAASPHATIDVAAPRSTCR